MRVDALKKTYEEATKGLAVFRQRVESNENGDELVSSKLRQAERVKKELKELKLRLKERSQMSRSIDRKYALYRSRYILRTGEIPSMDILEESYADVRFLREGDEVGGDVDGVDDMDEHVDEHVDDMDEHVDDMDEHVEESVDDHVEDPMDHPMDDPMDDYHNTHPNYPDDDDDTPYDTSYDASLAFTVDFLPHATSFAPSLDFEVAPLAPLTPRTSTAASPRRASTSPTPNPSLSRTTFNCHCATTRTSSRSRATPPSPT